MQEPSVCTECVSCWAAAKQKHSTLYPAWLRQKKRFHHSLPVGCLVDSNKRSSRFTGAHWRTRSSEHSAQSQDLQSPQPIRGYTGGLSCWWVGQSTAMKHRQLPVLLQMDDETGNYGVQVETRSCVLNDRQSCGFKSGIWGPMGVFERMPWGDADKKRFTD